MNIYKNVRESFSRFLYIHAVMMQGGKETVEPIRCPVCIENTAAKTIRIATDACFSLKNLRRENGSSDRQPVFGTSYFVDRRMVNDQVERSTEIKSTCNHRAGDTMGSQSMRGLDVTAVMSTICEHDMFLTSLCLSKGEKFGYPNILLKRVCNMTSENTKIISYYDINCTFSGYWKVMQLYSCMIFTILF